MSARELGKPLVSERYRREWEEGISVYDDFDYAAGRSVIARFRLGKYIAEIEIPKACGIDVEQTTRDLHHFTIYATGLRLIPFVRYPAIPAGRRG